MIWMVTYGSIIKTIIKGNNYFYLVESKRIDGRLKYVNQVYLGLVGNECKKIKCKKSGSTALQYYTNDFVKLQILII